MRAPAAFAVFAAVGLALAAHTLAWPLVYDDLHLVRAYTAAELASSWHGHWDPDGVETAGYRPLSTLFNHARAIAFGENVAAHRVFLVLVLALDLALLVPVAVRVGMTPRSALAAGLLALTTRYAVYHYAWITDGNHVLQGLFFALAARWLLDGLAGPPAPLLASLAAVAALVLVREDSVAALPALGLVGLGAAPGGTRRRLAAWGAGAGALGAAVFVARMAFVPAAQPLWFDAAGFLRAVGRVVNPVGWESFDTITLVLARGWAVPFVGTLVALVLLRERRAARVAVLWLAAAVFACAPALVLQRDDLFFFPSWFVALFLAAAWEAVATEWRPGRPLAAAAAAWAILGGARTGHVLAENFHPQSARAVHWNTEMLYGDFRAARIPEPRRSAVAARLSALGIRPGEQPRQRVRALIAGARAEGRRAPAGDGRVFFPRLPEPSF